MRYEEILNDQSSGLAITLSDQPSTEIIDLLQRTVWGSRNLRYRILDVEEKLSQLAGPNYLALKIDDRLASVCVLNRRPSRLLDIGVDTFHFVMLATEPDLAHQGWATQLVEHAVAFCRENLAEPGIAYAYIESTTEYSLQISKSFDREYEATIPLTLFSRFRPSDDPRVTRLDSGERDAVVMRLSNLYTDHLFADFENSVAADQYHMICEKGQIVAGVQTQTLSWSMESLPGWFGPLMLRLIPHVPLRFPIDPINLHFLRFSNLLVEPGSEHHLVRLLEAMLARYEASVGLMLLDERSDVFRRLKKYGRSGFLRYAFKGNATAICGCKGLSKAQVDHLQRYPMLMSPLDVF